MNVTKYSGPLAILGFVAFLANTAIGKFWVTKGISTSPPIDGVPEFFLLAFATGFLAIWLLKKEAQQSQPQENQGGNL